MINCVTHDFAYIHADADDTSELFNKFNTCSIRVAVQKNGELTQASIKILLELFNVKIDIPSERQLISIVNGGRIGIIWAKNKSIPKLIRGNAVDMAIIGSDQLIEDRFSQNNILIAKSFENIIKWPLVLAVSKSFKGSITDIKTVASQFPHITKKILIDLGIEARVIRTEGSTEAYIYLTISKNKVNAITDISVTGKTLDENGLKKWGPDLHYFYPMLIANKTGVIKFNKLLADEI